MQAIYYTVTSWPCEFRSECKILQKLGKQIVSSYSLMVDVCKLLTDQELFC